MLVSEQGSLSMLQLNFFVDFKSLAVWDDKKPVLFIQGTQTVLVNLQTRPRNLIFFLLATKAKNLTKINSTPISHIRFSACI